MTCTNSRNKVASGERILALPQPLAAWAVAGLLPLVPIPHPVTEDHTGQLLIYALPTWIGPRPLAQHHRKHDFPMPSAVFELGVPPLAHLTDRALGSIQLVSEADPHFYQQDAKPGTTLAAAFDLLQAVPELHWGEAKQPTWWPLDCPFDGTRLAEQGVLSWGVHDLNASEHDGHRPASHVAGFARNVLRCKLTHDPLERALAPLRVDPLEGQCFRPGDGSALD